MLFTYCLGGDVKIECTAFSDGVANLSIDHNWFEFSNSIAFASIYTVDGTIIDDMDWKIQYVVPRTSAEVNVGRLNTLVIFTVTMKADWADAKPEVINPRPLTTFVVSTDSISILEHFGSPSIDYYPTVFNSRLSSLSFTPKMSTSSEPRAVTVIG